MSSARQTVAALSANKMPLPRYDITRVEIVNISSGFHHLADKFVTEVHGNGNRFTRPGIPVVDMDIRATNGGFMDANQHIVDTDIRFRYLSQRNTGFRFGLDKRLHVLLH